MGIVDKFKNLFTEEVEEEVKPIRKEVRHVEIPSPKRETREVKVEQPIERVSESSAVNKEEKFVFPVYFDDKDFDDLEKPKREQRQPVKKEPPKVDAYQGQKVQKSERRFEASPIISPVYGILDKNYKKEDISTRKEQPSDYTRKSKPMTVDDIRNKAFGTLEDDLEDTLFGNKSILFRDVEAASEKESDNTGIDIFEELHFDDASSAENGNEFEKDSLETSILNPVSEKEDTIFPSTEDDLDEDTIMLAKQLEEQKKKLEQINDYINENSIEEEHSNEEIENSLEETRSRSSEDIVEESRSKRNQESEEPNPEDLTESELLSLVDAMYEKRDEE